MRSKTIVFAIMIKNIIEAEHTGSLLVIHRQVGPPNAGEERSSASKETQVRAVWKGILNAVTLLVPSSQVWGLSPERRRENSLSATETET